MCGIVGYIGTKQAQQVVTDGLKRMEYRGYDSAGITVIANEKAQTSKKEGKLGNLLQVLEEKPLEGQVGIGHIRWATHGVPNDINAHPQSDSKGEVFVVHNGIIENFHQLKQKLSQENDFVSDTDTEVLAHLIGKYTENGTVPLEEAVQKALQDVVGTYGIAVVSSNDPEKIVAARMGSPLVLGLVGEGEYIIASDPSAIISYTRDVIYLDEGEIVAVTPEGYEIRTLDNAQVEKDTTRIDWDAAEAEKQGYDHFMLKEMMEQPSVIADGLRGRLVVEDGTAHLGGFQENEEKWREINRIIIVACGSAAIAGQVGEYMLEEYAGIPTEVEIGSEFRYRNPIIDDKTAVVVVSQSGETADTIASLREAKRRGALTFGIINAVGSTIAREVDSGMYIHAGPEIGVASTKAMIGMINMFALLTMALGRQRDMSLVEGKRIAEELQQIPGLIKKTLQLNDSIAEIAEKYKDFDHAFFLGRKYNYPTALEGALKLKELAYVQAEGYPCGELKHGPLALMDDRFYNMFIIPTDSVYEKNISNLQEVRARKGRALVIATEGNKDIKEYADDVIYIPKTLEMLTPLIATIPLQLFAYHVAVLRGTDVDQPRNLAKSVTVE